MEIQTFPFETINWSNMESEEHKGDSGTSYWKVFNMGDIRVRMLQYSANYLADHWCLKGHVIYCVDGEMETELEDGRVFILSKGMSYQVGDNTAAHRSRSANGCILFVVD